MPALASRLQAIADPPHLPFRPPTAVVGPEAHAREAAALSMAAVVLRAGGFQPLVTPPGASAGELAVIALRAWAAVVELDARLGSLAEDYQTRTRSLGGR